MLLIQASIERERKEKRSEDELFSSQSKWRLVKDKLEVSLHKTAIDYKIV
jgi:hypothetical protein